MVLKNSDQIEIGSNPLGYDLCHPNGFDFGLKRIGVNPNNPIGFTATVVLL